MSVAKDRLEALRSLLDRGVASTQEDLREGLARKGYDVNQSTISRDLRRLNAIRAVDSSGRMTYRLVDDLPDPPVSLTGDLAGLVLDIQHNGNLIVIHTSSGSASLIARQLDSLPPGSVLGTIAGDDTVFVAPADVKQVDSAMRLIRKTLGYFQA